MYKKPTSHFNVHHIKAHPKPRQFWDLFSQKAGWMLGGLIGLLFVFWILKPVFALLAVSAGLAYILDPLIDRLEEKGFSRSAGIGIVAAILGLLLCIGILAFVPAILNQMERLSTDMGQVFKNLDQTLQPLEAFLQNQFGLQWELNTNNLKEQAPQWIANLTDSSKEHLMAVLTGLLTRGMSLISTFLNLLLLPIFTFYLLRDWDVLLVKIYHLIPHNYRKVTKSTFDEVHIRLNAFVLGQIKVCLALSVLYSIGLLIVGIDLALPIGILSGLLFIIPYVGTIFGIVVASLLALINFGVTWHIIGVFAVFSIVQLIEGYYLTPKIIGESVGLSPLVVMIALIVGASLMGIWGMFLAIPVTAVLSVFAGEWMSRYKQSHFYLDQNDEA